MLVRTPIPFKELTRTNSCIPTVDTVKRFISSILVSSFTSNLFGVDIWNPMNVGSHSTDEQSRDQWVKRKVVYVRVGMCMDIN